MRIDGEYIPATEIKGTDLGNVKDFVQQHKQVQGAIMIYIDHEGLNAVYYYRNAWARGILDEVYAGTHIATNSKISIWGKLADYVAKYRKHKGVKNENNNHNPENTGD